MIKYEQENPSGERRRKSKEKMNGHTRVERKIHCPQLNYIPPL